MLKVFVDSASSIKQSEKERYDVEIIPLRLTLGDKDYLDGIDLDVDEFYEILIKDKVFPKTSLPSLEDLDNKVNAYTEKGDDVIILTISSEISGTYNAIATLFKDNAKVRVVDTRMAAGGIRLLVEEINRYRNEPLDEVVDKVQKLIPRVRIAAIPENLDYLLRGGRLSKKEWVLGSMLKIKPVIGFVDGKVRVISKKIGLKNALKYLANYLDEEHCDKNHSIVASYTYNKDNLDKLIELTDPKYHAQMTSVDNLDPVLGCHWGPNAFGYIFISEDKEDNNE